MESLGWAFPARVLVGRSVGVGWWSGLEMANSGSGNTFMLILFSFGRKRPWGKNKSKTRIPSVTGHKPAHTRGKSTGPHPGGPCPVDVLVPFGRVVPTPELLDLHLIKVPEVRLALFSGWAK